MCTLAYGNTYFHFNITFVQKHNKKMNVKDVTTGTDTFVLLMLDHLCYLRQKGMLQTIVTKLKCWKISVHSTLVNTMFMWFSYNKLSQLSIALLTLVPNYLLCEKIFVNFSLFIFYLFHYRSKSSRKRCRTDSSSSSEDNAGLKQRKWPQVMWRTESRGLMCCCLFCSLCKGRQYVCCTPHHMSEMYP